MWPPPPKGTWVVDLDGVVWLAEAPSPESTRRWPGCAGSGCACCSPPTTRFRRGPSCTGIWCTAASPPPTPTCCAPPTWPPTCWTPGRPGGPGRRRRPRGSRRPRRHRRARRPADAVVVGLTRSFTYEALAVAVAAVRGGARLYRHERRYATYPAPEDWCPGRAPSSPPSRPPAG